jgi:alpha-beta hydrolase superfamily lysophospholipase
MTIFNEKQFTASDAIPITYYQTPKPEKPKGIVLIIHGMAEYAERYERFANYLYEKGYLVIAHDQRGHGKTAQNSGKLGYFSDNNGWQRIVDDVKELSTLIKNNYPTIPLFILGHSMGSIVARTCIIQFSNLYNSAIIIGTTTGINHFARKAAAILARHEIRKNGLKKPSLRLTNLSFGGYGKKLKTNRTTFDWLSLNEDNVNNYIADPLCGFTCTNGFFQDLFYGINYACSPKNIKKIPSNFPMIFLSGKKDPVGRFGKEVQYICDLTEKCGHDPIEICLFDDLRHEILNEESCQDVYQKILEFLNNHRSN